MSRPNKNKVPTDSGTAVGGGLFQAFAGLEVNGLPEIPAESAAEEKREPAANAPERPSKLGRVVLRRETAHRAGKSVLVVDGFDPALSDDFLENLAKKLRAVCGCGGAFKGRAIELQGEQAKKVREFLTTEGFRVAGIS